MAHLSPVTNALPREGADDSPPAVDAHLPPIDVKPCSIMRLTLPPPILPSEKRIEFRSLSQASLLQAPIFLKDQNYDKR